MKEITILSGKGGTGKTSFTAAFSGMAQNAVLCDNDVDAADLHLILFPQVISEHEFVSGCTAHIHSQDCTQCGLCLEHCRFGAIRRDEKGEYEVNPFLCEGCRLCERICPAEAICSVERNNNAWYESSTRFGTMVHAKMGPGEENSGKLVSRVRAKAKEIARETGADYVINDGPPGIGCTAISALSGTNLVVLVTEPTKSGLNDVSRLVELIKSFHIPMMGIINKADLNEGMSAVIEQFFKQNEISLLAKIPFDKAWVESMVEGKTIVEYAPQSDTAQMISDVWRSISSC